MKKPLIRSGLMVENAVNTIRDRILDLSLAPSSHINEKELTKEFGLSRTPMREALNRLITEGLIDVFPNRGAFVHKLDLEEVGKLFEAYAVSEQLTGYYCNFSDPDLVEDVAELQRTQWAAVKAADFLEVTYCFAAARTRIARTCDNDHIFTFCQRLNNHMRRLFCYVYLMEAKQPSLQEGQLERTRRGHLEIQNLLREGDHDKLVAVQMKRLANARLRVGRAFSRDRNLGVRLLAIQSDETVERFLRLPKAIGIEDPE